METSRILAFEGVDNFRDYGDYATHHGARLARGVLYRSAHHAPGRQTRTCSGWPGWAW
jgi:protein tyrosine/serine phosphatase